MITHRQMSHKKVDFNVSLENCPIGLAMKTMIMACIDANSAELAHAEQQGQLPINVIQAIAKLGFFDLARPRQYGGQEIEYHELLDIITSVASRSGSLAWYMVIMSEHNIVARLFPTSLTDLLFQSQPMLLASSVFPAGKAVRQGDHYLLSGTWHYVTGVHHASWVMVNAEIINEENGRDARFLVPPSRFIIHDDWDAIGMRASGSNSVSLKDEPVPLSLRIDKRAGKFNGERCENRIPRKYRIPGRLLTALGTTAPIIGLVKGMAQELQPPQTTHGLTLEQMAERARLTELQASTQILHDSFQSMTQQVSSLTFDTNLFTHKFQQDVVLRCAMLTQQCRLLASNLFTCGGTRAAQQGHPLAIKLNDIHVMSTHYLVRQERAEINSALANLS